MTQPHSPSSDDSRLSRIESKVDKLSDAVVMLARVEERQTTLFSRMDVYDETLRIVGQKMNEIENILAKRGVVFCILERGWWIIAGTGITLLLTNTGDILRFLTN